MLVIWLEQIMIKREMEYMGFVRRLILMQLNKNVQSQMIKLSSQKRAKEVDML